METCFVTGCPNRSGDFNRPKKNFFSFPSDPQRIKVWLAALRETDRLDSEHHHLICEDHFLKEDITSDGVKGDAIPIMSPYLDGSIDMISSWEPETHEEKEEEEEEDFCVDDAPAPTEPPEPPAVDPPPAISSPPKDPDPKETAETEDPGSKQKRTQIKKTTSGVPLPLRFLRLMQTLPGVTLEVTQVTDVLQTDKRRISDISSVLEGINLLEKRRNRITWIGGRDQILQDLRLMEEELDRLIQDVFQQLLEMTNDRKNADLAYVTLDDIRGLEAFREQVVMVLRAPDGTLLKVPEPSEDFIQIHVRSWSGPVTVLTCDVSAEDLTAERNVCFSSLEESWIKASALHGEVGKSSGPVLMSDVKSSRDASTS